MKWVEKEERCPRRKNLWRDEDSGTGVRRIPQNGDLGLLDNRGARHRLFLNTPTPGWCIGAVQSSPKGTIRVASNNPEQQEQRHYQTPR